MATESEGTKELPTRSLAESQASETPKEDGSLPDFIVERNRFFEELWQEWLKELQNKPRQDINITIDLGDGNTTTVTGKSWETTPATLLKHVPKEISANAVISKVDGELWDLSRYLEKDCKVSYLPFDSPEGREVFWHSSAHCLGEACELEYGCLLSHGPPTAQGFFYDMAIPGGYVDSCRRNGETETILTSDFLDESLKRPIGHRSTRKQLKSSKKSKVSTDWRLLRKTFRRCLRTASTSCITSTTSCKERKPRYTVAELLSISAVARTSRTLERSRRSRSCRTRLRTSLVTKTTILCNEFVAWHFPIRSPCRSI